VFQYLYKKLIRPIFTINDTPHAVALGVSLGIFIGFTPTVGFQLILVALIGTLIKANRIIALILCWVSNPITFIPLYYVYYWFGAKLLNISSEKVWSFGNFQTKIDSFMVNLEQMGYWTSMNQLGSEIFKPLLWGSMVIALVLALPLYPITRSALIRRKRSNSDLNSLDASPVIQASNDQNKMEMSQPKTDELLEKKSPDALKKIQSASDKG